MRAVMEVDEGMVGIVFHKSGITQYNYMHIICADTLENSTMVKMLVLIQRPDKGS